MKVIQVTVSEGSRMGPMGMSRRRTAAGIAMRKTTPQDAARAVRRVLEDTPVAAGQQALLKALYEAGDAGLRASELAACLNRNEGQLDQLLARLARRIRRTPDAAVLQRPGITLIFDVTPDEGEWRYKLRRVTRKALAGLHPDWAERQSGSAADAA